MSAIQRVMIGLAMFVAMVVGESHSKADVVTDDFPTGPFDVNKWFGIVYQEGTAALTQTNDRLEFTAEVTPDNSAEVVFLSKAVGLQLQSWEVEISCHLGKGDDFSGMGDNDVVALSLIIRPTGPASESNGEDGAEMNFGLLQTGPGTFDHVVRFNGRTNDSDDGTIVFLNNPDPLTIKVRLAYNAGTQLISGEYDVGSSYVPLGNPVDTSAWGMDSGEVFLIALQGLAGTLDDNPPTSTYSVTSGKAYFDDFRASGDGITLIPEPAIVGMLLPAVFVLRGLKMRIRAKVR